MTVDGFTIVGQSAVGAGQANSNILLGVGLDTVIISNNRLRVGLIGSGTTGDDGIGVINTFTTTTADFINDLRVTGNLIVPTDGTQATRPYAINTGVDKFLFDNNTITGDFTRTAFTSALDGTVSNNTYTGTDIVPGSRSGGFSTFAFPDATFGKTSFTNNTVSNTGFGVSINGSNNVTVTGNTISNTDRGLSVNNSSNLAGFDPATLSVSGNTFTSNVYHVAYTSANNLTGEFAVVGNTFDGVLLNASTPLLDVFTLADKVLDKIDAPGNGLVRLRAGNIFVTPNSFFSPTTTSPSIQRAVDAATTGDVVQVQGGAGTYTGNVSTAGKAVTLAAGPGPAVVQNNGDLTLDGNDTLAIDVNNAGVGTGIDRWIISGAVTLNGATLTATGNRTAGTGAVLVFMQNDLSDAVTGIFQGLPEGASVVVNSVAYTITYTYNAEAGTFGDGNDVALVDVSGAASLPFTDDFNRPNSTNLGAAWTEVIGDIVIANNMTTGNAADSLAVLNGILATDVAVKADVSNLDAGEYVGLVARYGGPGFTNFYLGLFYNTGAVRRAILFRNVNGAWAAISSDNVVTATGTDLRFEVVGTSQKLFLGNTLLAFGNDTAITTAGSVGMRILGAASLDNFRADPNPPANGALNVTYGFNATPNGQLDNVWAEKVGNFRVNGRATGNAPDSLAVLNGVSIADVRVEADVSNLDPGEYVGLVARYGGPGFTNFYVALLYNSGGTRRAVIFRNVNEVWAAISTDNVVAAGLTGRLRFDVFGTTQTLSIGTTVVATANDTAITTAGSVGMRILGDAALGDFRASALPPI